jgi:predicted phosphodiesterase
LKKILQILLGPLFTGLASAASAPNKKKVFNSLTKLLRNLNRNPGRRGLVINTDFNLDKFIIFSDHHKGNKDEGDDFAASEKNYLSALEYYFNNKFQYVNLGDSEELWKYKPEEVISKNTRALQSEARFHNQKKFYKTFGNHDLIWKDKFEVQKWFKGIFELPLPIWEGILLRTKTNGKSISVFLTHGHQGDQMSDNNAFSTWLVSHLWRPMQRYLQLNVNTPAKDFNLKDRHNIMMYEWSSFKKNLLLITGHTHKPVFASGLYSDHPNNNIPGINTNSSDRRRKLIPSYFNSGCCCYSDADITGIEIADGKISLVKWHWENNTSEKTVLEEVAFDRLVNDL